MDALEGLREPLSEGVRMLLLDEVQQMRDRLRSMTRWLQALDPALAAKAPGAAPAALVQNYQQPKGPRPSRKSRQAQ